MKLFHVSDLHLSFDEFGKILKPMYERKWAQGTHTYVGYLEKLLEVQSNITNEDIVFITGDLTHDMPKTKAQYSIKWINDNLKGIKVACKGNHDRYYEFKDHRTNLTNLYLLDSKETISINNYFVAAFNEVICSKGEDGGNFFRNDNDKLLEFAKIHVEVAKEKALFPVIISHYPVPLDIAEQLGKMGLKYYLSGHIHCTNSKCSGGISMNWYNQSALPTDDKIINGCIFSTGTTDTLLVLHNKIVKELPTKNGLALSKLTPKEQAAQMLKCKPHMCTHFKKDNPFFEGQTIEGYINHEKGLMGGSIIITRVNDLQVEPQLIYGTPKLAYPYKQGTNEFNLPEKARFILANKWNGMNVLFYKYKDDKGVTRWCAKSKGTAVINNSEFGNFLDLTKLAMDKMNYGDWFWPFIYSEPFQSISCELCGYLEPHLVKYDFDIALQPLFTINYDGKIRYYQKRLLFDGNPNVVCQLSQETAFQVNEEYRKANNLPLKYEYNHFAVEGDVLYLLDDEGYVINRTLYKIKPKDIEEVHWQTFDATMQGRVQEAVRKCQERNIEINAKNIQEELDMGKKEWSKFGKDVMKYITQGTEKKNKLVILCGLPGSGKSTYALNLSTQGYVVVNQDTLGSANKCKEVALEALKKGINVVIDRTNIDKRQRKRWTDLAKSANVIDVECILFDVPIEECIKRVIERKGHPTVTENIPNERKEEIVRSFQASFEMPSEEEGFKVIKL